MSFAELGVEFDAVGIGDAIAQNKLLVPVNQRPYAWEEPHVQRLYEDLTKAFEQAEKTYFLGTIVLAHGQEGGRLLVADGQQRLATVSILIAAIRDYLSAQGPNEKKTAVKYTSDFLLEYDEFNNDHAPKLQLNAGDHDFFTKAVLPLPEERVEVAASSFSHERLRDASRVAGEHVASLVSTLPKQDRPRRLYDWIKFLRKSAVVIAIRVPHHIDAFKMFETLNDRGLRASQIDILKNFLFFEARASLKDEAQLRWASMVGIIESIGDDELLLRYVRHFWITRNGPTVEDKLAQAFKDSVKGRKQATDVVVSLDENASDYVALLTPLEHPRFAEYGKDSREFLAAITTILRIEQIRPLLLAILRRFQPKEAKVAFEKCLSWSVRFLVAGGGGGGVLDRHYGLRAKEVSAMEIKTAKELSDRMAQYVPTDAKFVDSFKRHQVSKAVLARYYLHSLENCKQQVTKPQIGYFENPEASSNLEHIMPDRPCDGWVISVEDAQTFHKRLGNMALMPQKANSRLGVKPFSERKAVYASSPWVLTQEVATSESWTSTEIQARQERLSKLAAKTWPL